MSEPEARPRAPLGMAFLTCVIVVLVLRIANLMGQVQSLQSKLDHCVEIVTMKHPWEDGGRP